MARGIAATWRDRDRRLPPFLVAVAIYAPIVFTLVSLQRWIERRQAAAEAAQ